MFAPAHARILRLELQERIELTRGCGDVCLFFFGGNCRSKGCMVLRELHVIALGAHSPSTCEQAAGQSSFHTWVWFAAHIAASASAEVSQGEALLHPEHDP